MDSARDFLERPRRRRMRDTDGPPHSYYRLRHDAIMAYGGYRCACCGEGEPMFLTLDHINNDGTRHRREVGTNQKILRSLQASGYPPGFQVLCSNCNHGRHRNGGTCPHKKGGSLTRRIADKNSAPFKVAARAAKPGTP